jgi:segregation and condensation protein B
MISQEKQKAIIEAMLFTSNGPVSLNKMMRRLRSAAKKDANKAEIENLDTPVEEPVQSDDEMLAQTETQETVEKAVEEVAEEIIEDVNEETIEEVIEAKSQDDEVEESEGAEELVEEGSPVAVDDAMDDIKQQLMARQQELDQEISGTDVKTILKKLEQEFLQDDRGIELVAVAKGYQIRTKYEISEYLKDDKVETPSRFSPSSLETLSIVAYEQPVTRQRVEEVRGVDSGGVLKTLLDKNILRVIGRSDEPGKPLVYGTSKRFLEVFTLNTLKDLPSLQEYHSMQLGAGDEDDSQGDQLTDGFGLSELSEEEAMIDISASEQAILDDLDSSLKDLKLVEKEVVATHEAMQPKPEPEPEAPAEEVNE